MQRYNFRSGAHNPAIAAHLASNCALPDAMTPASSAGSSIGACRNALRSNRPTSFFRSHHRCSARGKGGELKPKQKVRVPLSGYLMPPAPGGIQASILKPESDISLRIFRKDWSRSARANRLRPGKAQGIRGSKRFPDVASELILLGGACQGGDRGLTRGDGVHQAVEIAGPHETLVGDGRVAALFLLVELFLLEL